MSTTTHSQQALHAAWLSMRGRAAYCRWPQDFDQVMADPLCMRLVDLEATLISRRPAKCPPPTDSAYRPRMQGIPTRTPLFDRKRAAAGERDDD